MMSRPIEKICFICNKRYFIQHIEEECLSDERILELALNYIDGKMDHRMMNFKERFTPEKVQKMLIEIKDLKEEIACYETGMKCAWNCR